MHYSSNTGHKTWSFINFSCYCLVVATCSILTRMRITCGKYVDRYVFILKYIPRVFNLYTFQIWSIIVNNKLPQKLQMGQLIHTHIMGLGNYKMLCVIQFRTMKSKINNFYFYLKLLIRQSNAYVYDVA